MSNDDKNIKKGLKELEKHISKITNGKVKLDENYRCKFHLENIAIYLLAVPQYDLLILKSYINFLPDPNSGMILPLYYHLLDMNDEHETGFAYFAIVSGQNPTDKDMISIEAKRPITDISFEEFYRCLLSVGKVSQQYVEKLEKEFQAPRVP